MRDKTPHIGIYGRTNAGKSSLLNRLTGQQVAIVSDVPGTTTDVVRRSYEVTGLGPVVFMDTAGIDDAGTALGKLRVEKTWQSLQEVDLGVIVLMGENADEAERGLIEQMEAHDIGYILAPERGESLTNEELLRQIVAGLSDKSHSPPPLFGNRKIGEGSVILFICPIDNAAPEGRLILPQVQALRAALDVRATGIVIQPAELEETLKQFPRPDLVVTDSQVFKEVTAILPEGIELTSFSTLLAEQKGDKSVYTAGLKAVDELKADGRVLIVENCSHQVTCDDIGRVKIPAWIREYTGIPNLRFDFITGRDALPVDDILREKYTFIVQCGGCVSTRKKIQGRILAAVRAGVPITNYGMLIRKLRTKKIKS